MKLRLRTRLGIPTRTKVDWEEAALDAIAAGGLAAVSIPELARSMGVTKGSFYWHFSALEDLVIHAVKRWEDEDKATLDRIRAITDAGARLRRLFTDAMNAKRGASLLHALSLSPPARASAALRRVSQRRLQFLIDAYRELGLSEREAQRRALLTYTAYVGAVHLRAGDSPWLKTTRAVDEYVDYAGQVLIGTSPSPSAPTTP